MRHSINFIIISLLIGCAGQDIILLQKTHTGAIEKKSLGIFSIGYGLVIGEDNLKSLKEAEKNIPDLIRKEYCFKFVYTISTENYDKSSFIVKDYDIKDQQLTFQIPYKKVFDSLNLNYGLIIKSMVISKEPDKSFKSMFAPSSFNVGDTILKDSDRYINETNYTYADFIFWNYETDSPISYGMIKFEVGKEANYYYVMSKMISEIFNKSPFEPIGKESSIYELKNK